MQQLQHDGRLVGLQSFYAKGKTSIVFLAFYGYAGARWESSKAKENLDAIRAIVEFAVGLGAVPVVFGGDFNQEICEKLFAGTRSFQ